MILIIGGAGLIGSHVVKRLGPKRCIVVDDLSRGSPDNLPAGTKIYPSVEAAEKDDITGVIITGVIFLAALPVFDCAQRPLWAWYTMINLLRFIAELCAYNRVKLVYASSGSVYGEQSGPISETAPLFGTSDYARLKIVAEHVLQLQHGLDFVGLRFQSVYGNAVLKGYEAVIPKFLRLAREGKPLPVYGSGSESYDFVHVDDAARAVCMALTHGHGFYNICTGVGTKIKDLAAMIGQPEFVDGPIQITHMLGDPGWATADLGWTAEIDLKQGLQRCAG